MLFSNFHFCAASLRKVPSLSHKFFIFELFYVFLPFLRCRIAHRNNMFVRRTWQNEATLVVCVSNVFALGTIHAYLTKKNERRGAHVMSLNSHCGNPWDVDAETMLTDCQWTKRHQIHGFNYLKFNFQRKITKWWIPLQGHWKIVFKRS